MRRSDVQHDYHDHYGKRNPMVNVKVYGFPNVDSQAFEELCDKVATENRDGQDIPEFTRFARAHYDTSSDDWTFGAACEQGFEMLEQDAQEIFGQRAKVYATGRSGGWAVVEGLPDIESWDAILVGKWARFCRYARAYVEDIPYSMLTLLYINDWNTRREAIENANERAVSQALGVRV